MPLLVERQAVDAHFAVDARLAVDEVLVDAVVNDVPLILARNLEDGVMGCAVNLVFRLLLDDQVVLLIDGNRTEGRLRGAVTDVVIGTPVSSTLQRK